MVWLHIQEGYGEPWRRWFAWRPVRVDGGKLVWLRTIERRKFHAAWWFLNGIIWWWEYRMGV